MRETMTGIPSLPLSRPVVSRPPIGIVLLLLGLLSLCLALFPRLVGAQAAVIFVDDTAEGSNDGTSWADAYTDLQAALEQATGGEEIWVAAGVYLPTQTGDRSASFELRSGVAMYGGFAGTETLRSERDWLIHLAVLSGDIDRNDLSKIAGVTTESANIVGENSYHVVIADVDARAGAVLDGFVVTAGKAESDGDNYGGGLRVSDNAQVTLRNLRITGNYASKSGGGVSLRGSTGSIARCSFQNNAAPGLATYDGGGGLYIEESVLDITNSAFSGNVTANLGGGINLTFGSRPQAPSQIYGVLVFGNAAKYGGGLSARRSNYELVNATLAGNTASQTGGGIYNNDSAGLISNGILWTNTPNNIQFGELVVSYCLTTGFTSGEGNLEVDPGFMDPNSGDFHLRAGSPAIDSGSNEQVPALLSSDLDGYARVSDGDTVAGAQVDRGAYEWPGYGLTVDVVGSGQVTESRDSGTFPFIQSLYYPPGYSVTVTAEPAEGWTFAGWSGDVTGSQPTADILMTASKVVTATFTGPAAVTMGSFAARSTSAGILLTWETESEIDMLGFYLRRSESFDGPWEDLNGGQMIPVVAPGQMEGSRYRFLDSTVVSGERYVYQLEQVGLGFLENSPNAIHTVEARHWGFFWFLPIVTHPMMVGP